MLEKVVKEGIGVYAQSIGRPIAAKTGTSSHARDNWFMGFTPQLVSGVWVGLMTTSPAENMQLEPQWLCLYGYTIWSMLWLQSL